MAMFRYFLNSAFVVEVQLSHATSSSNGAEPISAQATKPLRAHQRVSIGQTTNETHIAPASSLAEFELNKLQLGPCHPLTSTKFSSQDRVYFFTHIPKCAGWSFCVDAPTHLEHNAKVRTDEACMSHFLSISKGAREARHLVMLRQPQSHVLSQHLECVYDPFFKHTAPSVPKDLNTWLAHFGNQVDSNHEPPAYADWGIRGSYLVHY